jgi:hypothetical protein
MLQTDKPSRLHNTFNILRLEKGYDLSPCNQNIYITSSNEEIKKGDYILDNILVNKKPIRVTKELLEDGLLKEDKKIILTTEEELINDGVQAIDDEFLEWFVKNPSCEGVKVERMYIIDSIRPKNLIEYKIIIPQEEPKTYSCCGRCNGVDDICILDREEPKQETAEEASFRLFPILINNPYYPFEDDNKEERDIWINGAKWQAERMYSEEEVKKLLSKFHIVTDGTKKFEKEWFEQNKKK